MTSLNAVANLLCASFTVFDANSKLIVPVWAMTPACAKSLSYSSPFGSLTFRFAASNIVSNDVKVPTSLARISYLSRLAVQRVRLSHFLFSDRLVNQTAIHADNAPMNPGAATSRTCNQGFGGFDCRISTLMTGGSCGGCCAGCDGAEIVRSASANRNRRIIGAACKRYRPCSLWPWRPSGSSESCSSTESGTWQCGISSQSW